MNSINIDGQKLNSAEIDGDNLEEILLNLMEHPSINNRVIIDVFVNGSRYGEDVPHAALDVLRSQINSLDLVTKTAEELGQHFLENGHYFIDQLISALPSIVENFRLGDEVEANEHFLSFLESIHLLITMLDQTKKIMGWSEKIEINEHGSLISYLNKLAETLTNMIDLQEKNDWIFLADILEYELYDLLTEMKTLLPLLSQAGH